MAKYDSSARLALLPPRISPLDLQFTSLNLAEATSDRPVSSGTDLLYSSPVEDLHHSTQVIPEEEAPPSRQVPRRSSAQLTEPLLRNSNTYALHLHKERSPCVSNHQSKQSSYTSAPILASNDGDALNRRLLGPLQPSVPLREALGSNTQAAGDGVFCTTTTYPYKGHLSPGSDLHRVREATSTQRAAASQPALTTVVSASNHIDSTRTTTSSLSPARLTHSNLISTSPTLLQPIPNSTDEKAASADDLADPRNVYTTESSSYWTGRYIGLSDRLHNSRTLSSRPDASQSSTKVSLLPESDDQFDRARVRRKEEVLRRLRAHCKTLEALKSFDAFERQLKLTDHKLSPTKVETYPSLRQTSNVHLHKRSLPASFRPSFSINLKSSPSNFSTTTLASSVVTEERPCNGSDLLHTSPLVKSKTFSNLNAQMFWNQTCRAQQSSVRKATTTSRALAVRERELRPSAAGQFAHRISSKNVARSKSTQSSSKEMSGRIANKQSQTGSCLQPGRDEATQVANTLKHTTPVSTATDNVVGSGSGSRRHKSESMRRFVDAGLREVMKMGRRVGSTSMDISQGLG